METRETLTREQFEPAPTPQAAREGGDLGAPATGYWRDAWRRLKQNPVALLGLGVIGVLVLLAIFGPMLTPYTVSGQSISDRFSDPGGEYWFGTDAFGRSLWDRVWAGTRVSLYIALLATAADLLIGVIYGAVSAYYGGRVDTIMQRIIEIVISIPNLVVVILAMLVLNPGILSITFAIALTAWTGTARLVRGQVLRLKEQEFFMASRALGASPARLIFRHLIPNVVGIIIITLMFTVPSAIFFEAFLSFIGLGIRPPDASLGALISDGATQLTNYPYLVFIPGVVISLFMISFNLLGDGLRDALDPKLRN